MLLGKETQPAAWVWVANDPTAIASAAESEQARTKGRAKSANGGLVYIGGLLENLE
jgi:hypothetical protein